MNIEQNTPQWLEFRKNKIGASDANIIMKVSPFKTPYQLWQEKLDLVPSPEETFTQTEGKRKEPIAKAVLESKLDMPPFSKVKLHSQRSWMMASLDAMSFDECVIAEIKCPGKDDHLIALSGQVPEKYYPQLQHQIEVCGVDTAYYFSFREGEEVLLHVRRDEKYIKELLKQEEKFMECLQNFEAPELTERDFVERQDPKWIQLTNRLKEIRILQEEEEEIKKQLISLSEGKNSMGNGIRLTKCLRKGTVDYTKIPEIQGVDLEKYRKKAVSFWRIA